MAGLGPDDVDTAQIYDCFTYMVLTQLEDYGFCKKGEGGPFVASGALRMGGRLPTNTSGGQLSEAHVEGMLQMVEGVRQLRHTYPARASGRGCRDRARVRPWRQPGLPLHADPGAGVMSERARKSRIPRPAPESVPVLAGRAASTGWSCRAATPAASSGFRRRSSCPHCLAADFAWTPVSGGGKVFSFVIFHRVYHPAFAQEVPYVVALVELEEGPRLLSQHRRRAARSGGLRDAGEGGVRRRGGRRVRAEIRAAERARQVMGALDTDMRVRCGKRRMPAACALLMSALVLAGTTASTAGAQEILLSRAPDRQQMILDGARKEGQVVLYSAAIVNQALRPLAEAFMKTYPFVKMTFWRGDTEEIVAKLLAEARAGNVVADVAEGTGVRRPRRRRRPHSALLHTHGRSFARALPRSAQPLDQHADQLFQHRL